MIVTGGQEPDEEEK
jgi:oxysterol-binding protein 1